MTSVVFCLVVLQALVQMGLEGGEQFAADGCAHNRQRPLVVAPTSLRQLERQLVDRELSDDIGYALGKELVVFVLKTITTTMSKRDNCLCHMSNT